jgi:hypothetical protein
VKRHFCFVFLFSLIALLSGGIALAQVPQPPLQTQHQVPITVQLALPAGTGGTTTTTTISLTLVLTSLLSLDGTEVISTAADAALAARASRGRASAALGPIRSTVVNPDDEDEPTASLLPTVTPTPVAAIGATAVTTSNLRAGPGTTFEIVGSAQPGQRLSVAGQNGAGDWYRLASGQWIAAFLVDNPPASLPVVEAEPAATPAPTTTLTTTPAVTGTVPVTDTDTLTGTDTLTDSGATTATVTNAITDTVEAPALPTRTAP